MAPAATARVIGAWRHSVARMRRAVLGADPSGIIPIAMRIPGVNSPKSTTALKRTSCCHEAAEASGNTTVVSSIKSVLVAHAVTVQDAMRFGVIAAERRRSRCALRGTATEKQASD